MHKNEAAELFSFLGDPDNVKILKFLYMNEKMSTLNLLMIVDLDEESLEEKMNKFNEKGFIKEITKDDKMSYYIVNKERVDELMDFVRTPCGCMNH